MAENEQLKDSHEYDAQPQWLQDEIRDACHSVCACADEGERESSRGYTDRLV